MPTLPIVEAQVSSASLLLNPTLTIESLSTSSNMVAPTAVLPPAVEIDSAHELPPILVADDDPDDRFFIKRLINKTGVKNGVRDFDDGSEVVNYLGAIAAAGAAARHHTPRLLFLDLRMNGLGGFGFLEWVRAQKTKLPLTIVVLSNSAESADMERARELGAHRYLVKYPSVQTFSSIVRSVYPFHLVA
jgi:CheY-like chemotaxis protein